MAFTGELLLGVIYLEVGTLEILLMASNKCSFILKNLLLKPGFRGGNEFSF